MPTISNETFQFLKDIKTNNNREWFAEHKPRYQAARANLVDFVDGILKEVNTIEVLPPQEAKRAVFRIYRDVRFSKNKLPYKTNLGATIRRSANRCMFYIHIEPSNVFVGGGLYDMESSQLKLIREDIDYQPDVLRAVLNAPDLKQYFGEMEGTQLKTAPKGYPRDHRAIDLLRYKQFLFIHKFTDKEAWDTNFQKQVVLMYEKAQPFFHHFDRALSFEP